MICFSLAVDRAHTGDLRAHEGHTATSTQSNLLISGTLAPSCKEGCLHVIQGTIGSGVGMLACAATCYVDGAAGLAFLIERVRGQLALQMSHKRHFRL